MLTVRKSSWYHKLRRNYYTVGERLGDTRYRLFFTFVSLVVGGKVFLGKKHLIGSGMNYVYILSVDRYRMVPKANLVFTSSNQDGVPPRAEAQLQLSSGFFNSHNLSFE